jgi:outer membrane immunogenic protein
MKRPFGWALAAASLLSIATAGAASAADMAVKALPVSPPATVYNWTGWYVGVNGGWAFDNNSTGSLVAFAPTFAAAVAAGGTPTFFGAKHEGGFGGGQVGYNWQMANWLVGVEADIQGADIGRTSTVVFPGGGGIVPSTSTGRDHIDWFGTLRGRVGVTAGPALFYGTGGLAYGGVKTNVTNVFVPVASGNALGSDSSTRVGWAAGAGVEWGFAPNWTVRGEYLHMDLGRSNVTIADTAFAGSATYRFSHVVDAVRVGVNYRFGPTAVVAKY